MSGVSPWLRKYRVWSTVILAISIAQMIWVTWWSTVFSSTSHLPGLEIAAVIAAVQVPVTMLFNSVYGTFIRSSAP